MISGRITFTPVTGTDRAYYRVEWLGCFGALLAEELEALSPGRPTSASASFIVGDPGGKPPMKQPPSPWTVRMTLDLPVAA